ncbi:MAG: HTH-type transcriptional regulator Mce2R [Deltaproteobacteria bacterium ADurb.Bin510]|nr:MAG: HTH-type transcriptional regulator Mce2R [Deltaproteobacteria bacterium ADurb.Bin510]
MEETILSGRLAIGEKLPTERELAEQMKISRTVVNSGISEMARKGFLEVVPRKGVFIADYARTGNLETLASIMNYNGGRMDSRNYISILEGRIAIEVPSARKAAEYRTEQDLKELAAIITAMETVSDYVQAAELLFRFHHAICLISKNTIYPLVFNAFKVPTLVFWENHCRRHGMPAVCADLQELYGYIERQEAEQAGECIRRVVTQAMQEGVGGFNS